MMGPHPGHRDGPGLRLVLGPARVLNLKSSGRKRHALATVAINLGMEEEVRRQPAAGRGINPSHPVPENERGHRGTAILVLHVQHHQDRGVTRKEDVHVATKAEVLSPLADIKAEFGLALAGVAAVNLDDSVLDRQSRELALQGAVAKHGQVHPALGVLRGTDRLFRLGAAGRLLVNRLGVWTGRLKLRGHTGLVVHLDQKHRPAVLHQPGSSRTLGRLHPALGVNIHSTLVNHCFARAAFRERVRFSCIADRRQSSPPRTSPWSSTGLVRS